MPEWLQIAAVIFSPVFAAGGAYAAVRVRLDWLRADVDHAHARIDELAEDRTLSTGKLKALLAHDPRPARAKRR